MKAGSLMLFISAWITVTLAGQYSTPCISCEKLKDLRLPDVTILETNINSAGHCRVLGRISKEIRFEVLLPQKWNQRFLMSGGGGFVGSIANSYRSRTDSGFVTAGTDTGHEGTGAGWALNNMERQLNFGHLAVHRTAVVSKAIIYAYYGSDPLFSYFAGASRGGGQALLEAQLYPEDFDGIVSIAPALNWTKFAAKFVQISQKNFPDPGNLSYHVITKDNLKILHDEVLRQCDYLDGIKDSIIYDPGDCKFDFLKLPVCRGNKINPSCLTAMQLEAIKTVYAPLVVNGDTIYPGFPLGNENEKNSWDRWIAGTDNTLKYPSSHYYFGTETFKYLVFNDPGWDYSGYDFSTFFKDTEFASSFLDADRADYSEFKKSGGKLIMVHGWNDPALSAYATIDHYRDVEKADRDIRSFFRLYLLPGVLHGTGGTGPDQADWIKLIMDWAEKGTAPDKVVLSKIRDKKVIMTRPVFPFPKKVEYDGKGNPRLESSFRLAGSN